MRVLIVLVCLFVLLAGCEQKKITDPDDPNFDPMSFQFSDYLNHTELIPILRTMFPVGTDRSYVEKILIEKNGAVEKINFDGLIDKRIESGTHNFGGHSDISDAVEKLPNKKFYAVYQAGVKSKNIRNPFVVSSSGWIVSVIYDENNKVIDMISGNINLVHNTIKDIGVKK